MEIKGTTPALGDKRNKTLTGRNSCLGCLTAFFICAACAAALAFLLAFFIPPFSKHMHFGDKVKGKITVTLDGEPVKIAKLTCKGDGADDPKIKYYDNTVSYSIKGNEYEQYEFTCSLSDSLPEVVVSYDHFNDWEVSETEIVLELVSDSDGVIHYDAHFKTKVLGEDNKFHEAEFDRSGREEDRTIRIGY